MRAAPIEGFMVRFGAPERAINLRAALFRPRIVEAILDWWSGGEKFSRLNNLQCLSEMLVESAFNRGRPDIYAGASLRDNGDPCVFSVNTLHPCDRQG